MHCQSLLTAAVLSFGSLAAAAPLKTRAVGKATVLNKCAFPVWISSVAGEVAGPLRNTPPGSTYSEPYRKAANGGGISIKISHTESVSGVPVEQMEYTVSDNPLLIFYDMSEIDGRPFADKMLLEPSAHTNPECVKVDSSNAYHFWNDVATKSCSLGTDLTLKLCA